MNKPKKKWRPIRTNRRCVFLDINGKRCHQKASWAGQYHGDSEIYHNSCGDCESPTWVHVEFCKEHAAACP